MWRMNLSASILACTHAGTKPNPQLGAEQTIRSGLRDAVWEIAYTAHNYY